MHGGYEEMLERYYIEKEKQEKLLSRKNVKSDFYNGIYHRYEYPVLTREFAPVHWRSDQRTYSPDLEI